MPRDKSSDRTPARPSAGVFRELLGLMEMEATAEDESFGSPMITSVEKILTAEMGAEFWDADDIDQTGGRDLTDVEQTILGYQVKYSTKQSIRSAFRDSKDRGMYLLVRSSRLDTGEEFIWNTSAPLLVAKIIRLGQESKLPANVVIRGTEAGEGTVLKLKQIPPRAANSTTEPPF